MLLCVVGAVGQCAVAGRSTVTVLLCKLIPDKQMEPDLSRTTVYACTRLTRRCADTQPQFLL